MNRPGITSLVLLACAASSNAQPYATSVIASNNPSLPCQYCDPAMALGSPDGVSYSLGFFGSVILQLGLPVVDGPGPDLGVWEENGFGGGTPDESATVSVSFNAVNWTQVGVVSRAGGKASQLIDIAGTGMSGARYVKIVDTDHFTSPCCPGFDLNAVTVIVTQDCNNNGVLDIRDIVAGTSQDCNNNGVPDECESTAAIVVNSLADPGIPGDCLTTLREAIARANSTGNVTITFAPMLAGGSIHPTSALPTITANGVTINGDLNSDNVPDIEIDGTSAGIAWGLAVNSSQNSFMGLVINSFYHGGIVIEGVSITGTTITNCRIGTNISGTIARANSGPGIWIRGGASANTIGPGNLISGNAAEEIIIEGGGANFIVGNQIGTDVAGENSLGSGGTGVAIRGGSTFNVIGGGQPQQGNLISGNRIPGSPGVAIHQAGTSQNSVIGNLIGTNKFGNAPVPNSGMGVVISDGAADNTIGPQNTISGNDAEGVLLDAGAFDNRIVGNKIGTNSAGVAAIGNGTGVYIRQASNTNVVGGLSPEDRNIISGNRDFGVILAGFPGQATCVGNVLRGNFIGVDATGSYAIPNVNVGVMISNSGYAHLVANNIISGNNSEGLVLEHGAHDNEVIGNKCGTNAAGSAAIPNYWGGILLQFGAHDNLIGGPGNNGNVCSGNRANGITIRDLGSDSNQVIGNFCGTDTSGALPLPNLIYGVRINNGSQNNVIGSGNKIAFNGSDGVRIDTAATKRNKITQNSITQNTGAGITIRDSAQEGITPPVITSISANLVTGTVSAPDGSSVEIFNDDLDEGSVFLATVFPVAGQFSYSGTIPVSGRISATVTDPNGNTSEFGIGCGGACECADVATIRSSMLGQPVKVCNVVVSSTTDLLDSAAVKEFFVQDSTGGLAIFGTNAAIDTILASAGEGHAIDLLGTTSQFNGLFQLVGPLTLVADHGFVGIPTPDVVTPSDFQDSSPTAESFEGRLVSLSCVTFQETGIFVGVSNYHVSADGGISTITVRVSTTALNLVGTVIPCGPVNLRGIFGQFDTTEPRDGQYELLLRSTADITACPSSPDCNTNGVPDECDIASGNSQDCNSNGVPDECDIASGGTQTLTFASAVPGTITDASGLGTGFTHRLPGTGSALPANDPNMNLLSSPGRLLLTSTRASIPIQSLGVLEAPGFLLSGIGTSDFEIKATFRDVRVINASDQIWLYAGTSNTSTVRVGMHQGNQYSIILNNQGSGDVGPPGYFPTLNAFATGDDILISLGRTNGLWRMAWQNLTNPAGSGSWNNVSIPWLDSAPNLYVGVSASNPGSGISFIAKIDDVALIRSSGDCNQNGILDECDIASGAPDCNSNGVPDSCELTNQSILIVSSKETDSVLAFDSTTGTFVRTMAAGGVGGLGYPNGIALDSAGDLYVCSVDTNSVIEFSRLDGSVIRTFSNPALASPSGVVIREPDRLLVTNFAAASVLAFDLQTGQYIGPFVPSGTGWLDGPGPMLLKPDGHLLVSGQLSNKVHEYDANGALVGVAAQGNGLNLASGTALDPQGNLLVSSFQGGSVLKFAPDGSFLGTFVAPGSGGLTNPEGLAWAPNGNLLVCNRYGGNVLEFNGTTGAFVRVAALAGLNEPNYVTIGSLPRDCNANGIPDSCELAGHDCNNNGILDSCEIANGTSQDCNGNGTIDSCEAPIATWTQRQVAGPTPREWHAMAYDRTRGVTVLFGGHDSEGNNGETWEWDGSTWTLRATSGPSPRWGHAMAYDPARGVTVLFGGYADTGQNGETWEWNGNTWTLRFNSGPTPRYLHAMAYDSARGVTVLFGGYRSAGINGETWEWNGTSWTLRANSGPSPRYAPAMAYDAGRGVTVLFGGEQSNSHNFSGQTWEWNGTAWSLRSTGGPAPGYAGSMVYDASRGVDVMFGNYTGAYNAQTWEWDDGVWTLRSSTGPSPRLFSAMAYDSGRSRLVLFGGQLDAVPPYDGQTWERDTTDLLSISGHPGSQTVCVGASATFSVSAAGQALTYQWRKNGVPIANEQGASLTIHPVGASDVGNYDVVVSSPCGSITSLPGKLTVIAPIPASHYALGTICPASTITSPYLFGITDDGPVANSCWGQKASRIFSGVFNQATGKLWRVRQTCVSQQFGPTLCSPESVLVDREARWQSLCTTPNLLIVGGCNTVFFINPSSGTTCEKFLDPTFGHIGQMALDSMGRLFVGSVDGDSLNVVDMGVVEPIYSAPGLSPRAVAVDQADNIYVTCSTDGIMRKLAPDGTVLNAAFATGLTGAISQAIAPHGIFHGNLFVACGDRVMEVNLMTGASSVFLPCQEAAGIAFDPDGFMNLSAPLQNHILKVGPGLAGDMDGDGTVTLADVAGFASALMQQPNAPLPMITADMNGDGCSNGLDVELFVHRLLP